MRQKICPENQQKSTHTQGCQHNCSERERAKSIQMALKHMQREGQYNFSSAPYNKPPSASPANLMGQFISYRSSLSILGNVKQVNQCTCNLCCAQRQYKINLSSIYTDFLHGGPGAFAAPGSPCKFYLFILEVVLVMQCHHLNYNAVLASTWVLFHELGACQNP